MKWTSVSKAPGAWLCASLVWAGLAGCEDVWSEAAGVGGAGGDSTGTSSAGGSGAGTTTNIDGCEGFAGDCVDDCGNFYQPSCEDGNYVCPERFGCKNGAGTPAVPALWSAGYGGAPGNQSGSGIAVGPTGKIAVAAGFIGGIDFGGGALVGSEQEMRIALAQLTAAKVHIWSKVFGGAGVHILTDVDVDGQGNIYVAGIFDGEIDFGDGPLTGGTVFIAKLDTDGNPVWSKALLAEPSTPIALDVSGDVIAAVTCSDGADFGGGPLAGEGSRDACVVALDTDGNHLWSRLVGGPAADEAQDVTVGSAGEVVLIGRFEQAFVSPEPIVSNGQTDAFVVSLAADGAPLWARALGGAGNDGAASVVFDADGPVISGWYEGAVDFGGGLTSDLGLMGYIVWLDPVGGYQSGVTFRCEPPVEQAGEVWSKLALEPSGGVVMGAGCLWKVGGSRDVVFAVYSAAGALVWGDDAGDEYDQFVSDVAVAPSGRILLTGGYGGSPDFGDGSLPWAQGYDAFVAAFPLSP